jgi:hypothetical protein
MQALRGRGVYFYTFLTLSLVVSATPRPLFDPRKGPPVPIEYEAAWASELVRLHGLEEKSFASARDRTPVSSQTLY